MLVYSLDIVCDAWFAFDILVSLVVTIPAGTYPAQHESAKKFSTIIRLYCRHSLFAQIAPILLYQITSSVFLTRGWSARSNYTVRE